MSNLLINTEKLIKELDLNGKFELSAEEKARVNEQCKFHVSHVAPAIISKEDHEIAHARAR